MRKNTKIAVAVLIAGLVASGGSAFTATGLADTAGASQFVGGKVTQTVTGATLTNVAYVFADPTNTKITSITLSIAAADGVHVAVTATGGTDQGTFTCLDVATSSSSCTYAPGATPSTGLGTTGYTGLTGIEVSTS